jgi:hypothetical protein
MMAKVSGYARNLGIAIMMEHPVPGAGGRHRQTSSYGQSPDLNLLPRDMLAREIKDLRSIYQSQRLYVIEIRRGLQQIIQMNRSAWTGIFEKAEDVG